MKRRFTGKSIAVTLAAVLLAGTCLAACSAGSSQQGDSSQKTEKAATQQIGFKDYADQVSKLVQQNWPAMNKVWPTYDYSRHNFVLFYLDAEGKVKEARLLNAKENRSLKKEEYEGIIPPNPEGYDQLEFQGKPSIAMSVDDNVMNSKDSVNELYKTATHEMVHFYYQSGVQASADSSRSQLYPVEATPRLYRRMLYTRLIQAFEHPDKEEEYLGKAKYWLDKYNSEFKSEADGIRATDIAEATARYTENLSMFAGRNLSAQDTRQEAEKYIKKDEIFIAADKESYEIGYVAGLILDTKNPNWKENFYATGKGVPEVLLESVSPIADEPDKDIEEKITKKVTSSNADAKKKLKDIIAAKDDAKIPYLNLDVSKGSKSFYAESMFKYQDLSVMAGYTSKFKVQGASIDIQNTAIISGYEEANQYIRIPLTMKYEIKDGKLTINSEHLKADGIPVQTSKEGDRTVYSAVAED